MAKKNSKQTLKKINLDAFELRWSEEKLEIESKALSWKTVVGNTNYLYGYLLMLSDGEDGMAHMETQVRAMYCMSSMADNAAVVFAADNYFNLVRVAHSGAEMKEEDIDKNFEIVSDMVKKHVLECVKKAAEKAEEVSVEDQEEALEDVKLMTKEEEK